MMASVLVAPTPTTALVTDEDGYEIIPDVKDVGLFLMQLLPAEHNPADNLLCFYNSGCGSAGLSDRAFNCLKTMTTRHGPTVLEVAGGKSILIPYGEEEFHLELAYSRQKATFTGLRMPNITAEFPLVHLAEAWDELAGAAARAGQPLRDLNIDSMIGGRCVDVILGIRYNMYYPEPSSSSPWRWRLTPRRRTWSAA